MTIETKKKKKEKIFKTQANLAYVYMLSSPHPLFLSGFQNNLEIFIYEKKAERKRQNVYLKKNGPKPLKLNKKHYLYIQEIQTTNSMYNSMILIS